MDAVPFMALLHTRAYTCENTNIYIHKDRLIHAQFCVCVCVRACPCVRLCIFCVYVCLLYVLLLLSISTYFKDAIGLPAPMAGAEAAVLEEQQLLAKA